MDHPRPAEGRRGLVTRLAGRGGREVVRRLAHHPGISAAMTDRAARHYSRVVICGPRKRRRGLVTCLARGGGWEVVRRLAHDPDIPAAMTGRTTGRDPGVIHRGARPEGRRRFVARLAAACGWEVGRRFAQRRCTVMTAHATRHDPGVIKRGPHKRRGGLVTTLAGRRGRDVGRRLGHDPRIPAAMTARAVGRDPYVIHRGARPEGRRGFVARFAAACSREVGRRFAQRR